MKVSSTTSLQLLVAVTVAAPLTAYFSSTSKVTNAKKQDLNLPPVIENRVNTLGLRDDAIVEEDLASVTKRQGDYDGLLGGLLNPGGGRD